MLAMGGAARVWLGLEVSVCHAAHSLRTRLQKQVVRLSHSTPEQQRAEDPAQARSAVNH